MTPTLAYKEILDFLATAPTAESIAKFRPSEELQVRIRELIELNSEARISAAEYEELEEYLRIEQLMIMTKANRRMAHEPDDEETD